MPVTKVGTEDVIETGSVLANKLGGTSTIRVENLNFHLQVVPSQDPPSCNRISLDDENSLFTFVGLIPATGLTWNYDSVGFLGNRLININIKIAVHAVLENNIPVYSAVYTISYGGSYVPTLAAA